MFLVRVQVLAQKCACRLMDGQHSSKVLCVGSTPTKRTIESPFAKWEGNALISHYE